MTNDSTIPVDDVSRTLIREAAEWRLLGLLFERPLHGWAEMIGPLAGEVENERLRKAAAMAPSQASRGLHDSTFGPGGPAPPRLVSYRATLDPGAFLSELNSMYDLFAYRRDRSEPPDHVAVMIGAVSYLLLKQAYARLRGDDHEAAIAEGAARRMMQDYLRCMAEPLSRSLEASGIDYLALAAAELLARVGRPDRRELPVLPPDIDFGELTCSSTPTS